jgi:signal transduction histidine kinase
MTTLSLKLNRLAAKHSLRTVLIVAFVSQLFVAVGLIGWLSFRNGQQAVDDLASQLRHEITTQVQQHLQVQMVVPHLVNQINMDALELGLLKLNAIRTLDKYFWRQIQRFKTVSYIALATEAGEYIGAQIRNNSSIIVEILDRHSGGHLETWETDSQGKRTHISNLRPYYDPRKRPWYQAAVRAGQSVWSDTYVYFPGQNIGISANHPCYDNSGNLRAVASTDFTLMDIGRFLKSLTVGKREQIFIIERNGALIATSSMEKPFYVSKNQQPVQQLQAQDSSSLLTRSAVNSLNQRFGDLTMIDKEYQFDFYLLEEKYFLQVTPFFDQWGLDWLIVVVVSEADFLAQINADTQLTILFSLVALFLAMFLGVMTARWISQPILRLNKAAKALAQGQWQALGKIERQDEVGQLAHSFQEMAHQLQQTFVHLEEKVKERTQDIEDKNIKLASLNEELKKLNQEKSDLLSIVAHDLKNPLSAIQGAASLIQMDYDNLPPEELLEFARMIDETSQQMFELIKNLLDMNQLETGRMNFALSPVDLLSVLQRLMNDYGHRAKAKGIALKWVPEEEQQEAKKYAVVADLKGLQQILDNLLSNAIKYSPAGKHVIVRLISEIQFIRCEIEDEGPGLSEADQEKLFQKFTRLSAQPTGGEHSTGLGLFIVKQLVEAMAGQVWCESKLGQGAKFIVVFPRVSEVEY